jgi:NAD+ synthase
MIKDRLIIDSEKESKKIIRFIKQTLATQGLERVVIGLSGGLDSTTVYYLLKQAVPQNNIITINFPYPEATKLNKKLPVKITIPISRIVEKFIDELNIAGTDNENNIRRGNIVARVRMTILFDLAKRNHALVCGTENKSEKLLGYFTRFGDQASDLEPISHLYKTQVKQLGAYLGIPKKIIDQTPTAGLWPGQTDEEELGFSYEEADQVLFLHYDNKIDLNEISRQGFKNVKKIISRVEKNHFKQLTPFHF